MERGPGMAEHDTSAQVGAAVRQLGGLNTVLPGR